jgi:hypothetical protein
MKYIIAKPEHKIQKYNIQDKFIAYFIKKYENLIDWNKVKNQKDINNQIEHLFRMLGYNDYFTGYPGVDPEKELRLVEWKSFLFQHSIYSSHPAFCFIILRPLIEKFNSKVNRPPDLINEFAINYIYENIASGQEIENVYKKYRDIVFKNIFDIKAFRDVGNGWFKLSSCQNQNEECFKKINILMFLSQPYGWCTSNQSTAESYLSTSDMYFLMINNKAEVVIRTEHNEFIEIVDKLNDSDEAMEAIEKYSDKILYLIDNFNIKIDDMLYEMLHQHSARPGYTDYHLQENKNENSAPDYHVQKNTNEQKNKKESKNWYNLFIKYF